MTAWIFISYFFFLVYIALAVQAAKKQDVSYVLINIAVAALWMYNAQRFGG